MNKRQIKILTWLTNNPGLHTTDAIAEAVELPEFAVRTVLNGLCAIAYENNINLVISSAEKESIDTNGVPCMIQTLVYGIQSN